MKIDKSGFISFPFLDDIQEICLSTKKLENIVELDNRDKCSKRLRDDYEDILFEKDTLTVNLRMEYFLFCQEDEEFLNLCNAKNEIKLLEFLQAKLLAYQENRKIVTED